MVIESCRTRTSRSSKRCWGLAEEGNADAQFEVALAYEYGNGVTANPRIAFEWMWMAAYNHNLSGMNNFKIFFGVILYFNTFWQYSFEESSSILSYITSLFKGRFDGVIRFLLREEA